MLRNRRKNRKPYLPTTLCMSLQECWENNKQFNFTQTNLNKNCVNTFMLDFEIVLNVWTITVWSPSGSGDTLQTFSVSRNVWHSTSQWGQWSLINLVDHLLLLEANHWSTRAYKVNTHLTHLCVCRTRCSQNSSSKSAKPRFQQTSLQDTEICLLYSYSSGQWKTGKKVHFLHIL